MTDIRVAAEQARVALQHICTHSPRTPRVIDADWDNARAALASLEAALAALPGDKSALTDEQITAMHRSPDVRDALLAYFDVPGDKEASGVIRAILSHPAGKDAEPSYAALTSPGVPSASPRSSLSETDRSSQPLGWRDAVCEELELVLTDPESSLSAGATRALKYVRDSIIATPSAEEQK